MKPALSRAVWLRIGLLALCLLVFVPGGHIALPLGVAFLRFVNPGYQPDAMDWVILTVLLIGCGLSAVSCWRHRWVLLACAIGCYGAMILLVYRQWADPVELGMLLTAIPFAAMSVWMLCRSDCSTTIAS